jgi:uncharacterized protein YciI
MFLVLLRFAAGNARASDLLAGHNEWIKRGFGEGVFLLTGSLRPGLGGAIVAHRISLADLQARLNEDPFVSHGVVTLEILEIAPSRADPRLSFLLA